MFPRAHAQLVADPCVPDTHRFVQSNCLATLDGLANAPNLVSLNVSGNSLAALTNVDACPALSTLVAERTQLAGLDGLDPLAACQGLHTLDLQHNNISDPALLGLLQRLPALKCLYLKGNPVVGKIPSYRKARVSALPGLTFLDDRPVHEEERRCAEAWCAALPPAAPACTHVLGLGTALEPCLAVRSLRSCWFEHMVCTCPLLTAGRGAAFRRSAPSASACTTRRSRSGGATSSGCRRCGARASAR